MTSAEARLLLVKTLHEVAGSLDDPALAPRLLDPSAEIKLSEIDLDSLSVVEWGMQVETASGVEIDPPQMLKFETLGALAAYVAKQAK